MLDHRGFQQTIVEIAAAAERPEPALRMGEIADRGLGAADFALRRIGIALLAERHRMRKGVIADPVAFVMRALAQGRGVGIAQLFADHEEGGLDAVPRRISSTRGVTSGLGAVVERQCEIEHAVLRQVAG